MTEFVPFQEALTENRRVVRADAWESVEDRSSSRVSEHGIRFGGSAIKKLRQAPLPQPKV